MATPALSAQEEGSALARAGSIAFHSDRTGRLELYVFDSSTREVRQVTYGGGFEPFWSPDCRRLVFSSDRDGQSSFELYTVDLSSQEEERLYLNQPADDWAPAWSPDGRRIAFQTNQDQGINICVLELDGLSVTCLPNDATNAVPSWSPDGQRLLFVSDRDGPYDIYSVASDDLTDVVQITNNEYEDMHPSYSPDGSRIAFASRRANRKYDIYLVDADGTNEVRLTDTGGADLTPRWIDESQLLFASEVEDQWDIYVVNSDGSGLSRIVAHSASDKWPAWCPVAGE